MKIGMLNKEIDYENHKPRKPEELVLPQAFDGVILPTAFVYSDLRDETESRCDTWELTPLTLPYIQPSFALFDSEGTDPTFQDYAADLGNFVEKMAPWGKLVLAPVIELDDGSGNRREVSSAMRYIYEATTRPDMYRVTPLFIISTKLEKDEAKRQCLRVIMRDLMKMSDKNLADPTTPSGNLIGEMAASLRAWQDPTNRDLSTNENERVEKAFAAYVDNHMNGVIVALPDPNEPEKSEVNTYHAIQFERFRDGTYAEKIERYHNPFVNFKSTHARKA